MDNPSPPIVDLDQFLKIVCAVGSGGQAKVAIQAGEVQVNGEVETRRRRKLRVGDIVTYAGSSHTVEPLDD